MPEIILHHYPESPFSEKVRLLLGYKGLDYQSVIIPMIMPKPELMPLTGGYRKTPVMQIGADIYCDTAIISRVIDSLQSENTIFPIESDATAGAIAHWTDTFLFKAAVAVAFQPRGLTNNTILSDPEKASAFAADRAELSRGSTELRIPLGTAQPYFLQHLTRMEHQFTGNAGFLLGKAPTIADFSTYHCLWFIHGNPSLRDIFEPFPAVRAWMDRMRGLGRSKVQEISGAEALEIAKRAAPSVERRIDEIDVPGLAVGDDVEVMPIDYGFNPVRGQLAVASTEELALLRNDAQVGEVAVHFPRLGFRVKQAGD